MVMPMAARARFDVGQPTNRALLLGCSPSLPHLHSVMQKPVCYTLKIILYHSSAKRQNRKHRPKEITSTRDSGGKKFPLEKSMSNATSGKPQLDEVERLDSVSTLRVKAKREAVLKACSSTCGGLFLLGLFIQKVSNLASETGGLDPDIASPLSYSFQPWHLGVMLELVVTVSILRQLLLYLWPSFAESSEMANSEILGSLSIKDYLLVAFLPGISEEFLFRGTLLPLFGVDWKGATIAGLLFGVLHLNGGRKISFVIWASFVGILYGLAYMSTHSILVPMVAHTLNNLIGALIWEFNHVKEVSKLSNKENLDL